MVFNYLREFYRETTLGGFGEIGKRSPFFDKMIWITAVSFSCLISTYLIVSSLLKFYENPTIKSMSMKDLPNLYYIPAVTVCRPNPQDDSKIEEVIQRIWGQNLSNESHDLYKYLLKNITNFSYKNIEAFSAFKNVKNFGKEHFENTTYEVKQDFSLNIITADFFPQNKWIYVVSEFGLCVCFNCVYGKTDDWRNFNISNADLEEFFVEHFIKYDLMITIQNLKNNDMLYFHKPSDLPTYNHPQWVMENANVEILLQLCLNKVDESLEEMSISQRKCRYTDENNLQVFSRYTKEACMMQCRHDLAVKLCGCAPHIYSTVSSDKICDLNGLACLSQYKDILLVPRKAKDFECSCMEVCNDVQLKSTSHHMSKVLSSYQQVSITPDNVNYIEYHHTIIYTQLDMLASFGGTASLFLGFSLLSTVEFIYYFTVRIFVSWTKLTFVCRSKRKKILSLKKSQNISNNPEPTIKNIIKKTLKEWCEMTSFHAIKYIVNSRSTLIERILWICAFLLSLGCCIKMAENVSNSFYSKAVIIEPHISQVHLQTRKPTIALCPVIPYFNQSAFYLHGEEHFKKLSVYYFSIMYPSQTSNIYMANTYCIDNPLCPPLENITEILYKHMAWEISWEYNADQHVQDKTISVVNLPLSYLISEDTKIYQKFKCYELDTAVGESAGCLRTSKYDSEIGPCFLTESTQIRDMQRNLSYIKGDWETGISFASDQYYKVYLLSSFDVPLINNKHHYYLLVPDMSLHETIMPLQTIAEGKELRDLEPVYRGCRYPDENILQVHRVYSYTACIAECRAAAMMQLCGCIHPMSPEIAHAKRCGHSGIRCLEINSVHLLKLQHSKEMKMKNCDCLRECEGTIFNVIYSHYDRSIPRLYTLVYKKPREEYHRVILQGKLDYFVTVAGIVGLFLGASVMTLLELPYFMTVRLVVNFYQAINQWKHSENKQIIHAWK